MKHWYYFSFFLLLAEMVLAQNHTISNIKIHKMSPNSMQLAASSTEDYYAMVHTGVDSLILFHFDDTGNLEWGQRINRELQNSFDLITLQDGCVLFAALDFEGNSASSLFLGKISQNGALLWAKRLDHINGLVQARLATMEDGFLLSCDNSIGPPIGFLARFDGAGNILWKKSFTGMGIGKAVALPGGNIFVLASSNTPSHGPKLLKLKANGTLLWAKEYDAGFNLDLFTLVGTPDHAIICAGRASDDPFEYPNYWLIKIDSDGNIVWTNTYAYPDSSNIGYTYYYRLRFISNERLYLQLSNANGRNALFCFDQGGQFEHGWQYPQAKYLTDLDNIGNSALLSVGEIYLGNFDYQLSIFRLDTLGRLDACCIDSVFLVGSTQPAVVHAIQTVQGSDFQEFQETLSFIPVQYSPSLNCALPTITSSEAIICPGECVLFQASAPRAAPSPFKFNWEFSGGSPELGNTDMPGQVCYDSTGHYPVVLNIAEGDCIFQIIDSVEVCRPDVVPTAFTPNGDGANDIFKPLLFFPASTYQFSIYNRWGQKVFETFDQSVGWNGTAQSHQLPSDTYVWMLDWVEQRPNQSQRKKLKGEVTLIR